VKYTLFMQESKNTIKHLIKLMFLVTSTIFFFSLLSFSINAQSNVDECEQTNVIITEVLINPEGEDLGKEWIEIYNNSEKEINLKGMKVFVAGTQYKMVMEVDSDFILDKGQYALICESEVENCDIYTAKIGMQNGGNATDTIRINKMDSCIFDTFLYDSPNTNNLTNDLGLVASENELFSDTPENISICRNNLIDTNNSQNDFSICNEITPGKENTIDYSGYLMFSEILQHENLIEMIALKNSNYSNWYIYDLQNNKKYYFDDNLGYPLFTIAIDEYIENNTYELHSPDNKIYDIAHIGKMLEESSLCRLENTIYSHFKLCKPTNNSSNSPYIGTPEKLNIFMQSPENTLKFVQSCFISDGDEIILFDDQNSFLLSKESFNDKCNTSSSFECNIINEIKGHLNGLSFDQIISSINNNCYSFTGFKINNQLFIENIVKTITPSFNLRNLLRNDNQEESVRNHFIINKKLQNVGNNRLLSDEDKQSYVISSSNTLVLGQYNVTGITARFSIDSLGNQVNYLILLNTDPVSLPKELPNSSVSYYPINKFFNQIYRKLDSIKKVITHMEKFLIF